MVEQAEADHEGVGEKASAEYRCHDNVAPEAEQAAEKRQAAHRSRASDETQLRRGPILIAARKHTSRSNYKLVASISSLSSSPLIRCSSADVPDVC